jgi:hypothetical protein
VINKEDAARKRERGICFWTDSDRRKLLNMRSDTRRKESRHVGDVTEEKQMSGWMWSQMHGLWKKLQGSSLWAPAARTLHFPVIPSQLTSTTTPVRCKLLSDRPHPFNIGQAHPNQAQTHYQPLWIILSACHVSPVPRIMEWVISRIIPVHMRCMQKSRLINVIGY